MFTPNRTQSTAGSSRRRSAAPFNLTPRRSQLSGSKTSLSGRRSHVYSRSSPADTSVFGSPSVSSVFNTANFTVDSAGSSLPVLVNEAIALADSSIEITTEICDNGWAWLVCDRKLFVWRFKHGVSKYGASYDRIFSKSLDQSFAPGLSADAQDTMWAISRQNQVPPCRGLIVVDFPYAKYLNALCKEFALPPLNSAESVHKSSLIFVGKSPESTDEGIVSLLVITPHGNVKYWPNIVQNLASSIDANLDGVGGASSDEECFRLTPIAGRGYLIGTTRGALFHLSATSKGVSCSRLQVSHGMLAGIGRRVSSFFFSTAQTINVLNYIMLHSSSRAAPEVVMLTSTALRKWKLGSIQGGGTDYMVAEADLNNLLTDPISKAIWNVSETSIRMWPLDVAVCSKQNHLALLIAVADQDSSSRGHTTLKLVICICPSTVLKEGQDGSGASKMVEVIVLDRTEIMLNEDDSDVFSYQLLIPNSTSSGPDQAVVWKENTVIIKSLSKGTDQEDILPLNSTGDNVLGVGKHDGKCIMLASSSGLLIINTNAMNSSYISQNIEDSILLTPSASRPQTPLSSLPGTPTVSKAKIEQLESSDSGAQRLQAAFIHFNRMNIAQAKSIIEEAFGGSCDRESLENSVVFVSQELIDDYPAQDPRWAESVPQDSGNSSNSLILLHQLQDKQKAHQLYLNFLTEIGIWDDLGIYTHGKTKTKTNTQWLLVEHGEKLAAAVALRQKHTEHQGVVDAAIRKVLERRDKIFDKRGLTPQDVFYREVSRIQDILIGLLDTEEEMIGNSILSSREMFTSIAGVNEIFETMLSTAYQYRRSKNLAINGKDIEYSPWSVSTGRHSVRDAIVRQHHITFTKGLPEAEDGQQRAVLHSHLVSLADIVLTGYTQQIESVSNSPALFARRDELSASFKQHRTSLITPILDSGLVDKAANLAEKYRDFGILVELCDRKDDQERLSQYMTDFSSQGFSDFLFNWYLERGKFRKLLECASSSALAVTDYNAKLAEFLSSHPKIAWLHQIRIGDFMSAHNTLQYLAEVETHSALKKRNLLSLSKLSAVFSNENDDVVEERVDSINSQHTLLKYQESLPSAVLEKLGVTVDNMPVISAQNLIELYVSDDNADSNEVDFKKALDLLQFLPQNIDDEPEEMDDEDRFEQVDVEAIKHYIWCQAIRKDSWNDIEDKSNPLDACKHTILSKTLDHALKAGVLGECLPDVVRLLDQEELGDIRESISAQYLIRARFEQSHRDLAAAS